MPNVEANHANCQAVVPGNVCAADNVQAKQTKQFKHNEEFASEIHQRANLETHESKNIAGNQANDQRTKLVSERTSWN